MNKCVALVLNPNFGSQLSDLAKKMPVWVVSSLVNDEAIKETRRNFSSVEITTLYLRPNETSSDLLVRALYDVDEHHGVTSQLEPYTLLQVHGSTEMPSQQTAAELNFGTIALTDYGFSIQKMK